MSAGKKIIILIIILAVLISLIYLAISHRGTPSQSKTTETPRGTHKGKIVIKGSDTLLPLAQRWAEEFMKRNPDVSVSVSGGGSGVGIAALLDGTCDIADASRNLSPSEAERAKKLGLQIVETKVAIDGISVIVNPQNPIKSITLPQLKAIYTGKITSWKELGGPDIQVTAVGRDTPSGTYELFKEKVLGNENYAPSVLNTPSNNQIATTVSQDKGAIGYVGVAYADEFAKAGKVKILSVAKDEKSSAFMPTPENIKTQKYPLFRYLYNYTRGEPKGLVKEYLDFVTSDEGQKLVSEVGYIPLR
ncbi:PstS family phosphate ABC transporter substrate-binding protein [bacterium]|nr:PstS family phosphate ABC transporter substrate-binding protein [bacterium]